MNDTEIKQQAEFIFKEGLTLINTWFERNEKGEDAREIFFKSKDFFLNAARLGSIDAISQLTGVIFGSKLNLEEEAELVELTVKAVNNGTFFDYESLRNLIRIEDRLGGNALHEALIPLALKDNRDAIMALDLGTYLDFDWGGESLIGCLVVYLFDEDNLYSEECISFSNSETRISNLRKLSNIVRYGLILDKNETVADILIKRYDKASKWIEEKKCEYEEMLDKREKEFGHDDKYNELLECGVSISHEVPYMFWGTKEENDIVFQWIEHEAEHDTKVKYAFMYFLAECIEGGYGTKQDKVCSTIIYEHLAKHGHIINALTKLSCLNYVEGDNTQSLLEQGNIMPSQIADCQKKIYEDRPNLVTLENIASCYLHNICHEEIAPDLPTDKYTIFQLLYVFAQELRLYYKTSDRASILQNAVDDGFPPALLFADYEEEKIIGIEEYNRLCEEVVKP